MHKKRRKDVKGKTELLEVKCHPLYHPNHTYIFHQLHQMSLASLPCVSRRLYSAQSIPKHLSKGIHLLPVASSSPSYFH